MFQLKNFYVIESQRDVLYWNSKLCFKHVRNLLLQVDLSPQEMKIKDLENNITETTERCEQLQQLWLRQQTRIVRLAHQRNQQLRNINLIRKRKKKRQYTAQAWSYWWTGTNKTIMNIRMHFQWKHLFGSKNLWNTSNKKHYFKKHENSFLVQCRCLQEAQNTLNDWGSVSVHKAIVQST